MKSSFRTTFGLVGFCFFISGAAGLVYQVVWMRYLALLLGHTSYAVVAVLVAFMGGLALGNFLFGATADRLARPLACYGLLELVIGVYGILFPIYFDVCHDLFIRTARLTHAGASGLFLLKFGISLMTVLLPAVLMGATFPVLVRFLTRSLGDLRNRVAVLYALNSAGAALGCLVADFWWIPSSGLEVTLFGAVSLNMGAGLVALVLSLQGEEEAKAGSVLEGPAQAANGLAGRITAAERRLAVLGVGISGFVAMLYEVAWTRVLGLVLGSSTHAFALMLFTFITGIAVGSGLLLQIKRSRSSWELFGWAEVGLAVSLFCSMFFYQDLSFWFMKLAGMLARQEAAYPIYEAFQALVCFGVLFVPTVFLGMTLPLASEVASPELRRAGRSVGRVFAANTLGTIVGTVLTGLWLMPRLGLARTFAVGIVLNALLGLVVVTWRRLAGQRRALVLPGIAITVTAWLVGAHLDWSWKRSFSMGLWRAPHPPETLASLRETISSLPLEFHEDGACATVDVYAWKENGADKKSLRVNGKVDAGTQLDMITQLMLGHLPMLLHPNPHHVLVVGLGSGITCGAVLSHPGVESLDAVEISPEVVRAARHFSEFNGRVLDNPRLHLSVEDAKAYLQTRDGRYDAIISEPSNPWMAGVAAVFTQEYYQTCAAHLQPGGLMVQWMHDYETTDEAVNVVLRTFLSVFPYTSVWKPLPGDMILVGGTDPWVVDLEGIKRQFEPASVRADLGRAQISSLPVLLAHEIIPEQNGDFLVGPGLIHTDLVPELEPLAQEGFFLRRTADEWRSYAEDFSPRASTLLARYLQKHPLVPADLTGLAADFQSHQVPDSSVMRSLLQRWEAEPRHPDFPLTIWKRVTEQSSGAEWRIDRLTPLREVLMRDAVTNSAPLRFYASDLMQDYRRKRSVFYLPPATNLEEVLNRLVKVDPSYRRMAQLHLAELAWDRGDDGRCLELGSAALRPSSKPDGAVDFSSDPVASCAVLYRMAESLFRSGRLSEALAVCQTAKTGGYLSQASHEFPLLVLVCRKVETYVSELQNRQGTVSKRAAAERGPSK